MESNSSMEQQFIEKLITVIDKNLHNENFGVAELAEELGMFCSNLHRKIKDKTWETVSQYLVQFRLKLAAELYTG